jgi:WXXGXW repeat (2 copies)
MNRSARYLLLALLMLVSFQPLRAQVAISVGFGPPALPVYEQPLCPEEGYIWTPGYWAYDDDDGYYWIPGTWVLAPQIGYLWTPPWWGWGGNAFLFHEGYWGPQVGFYGGINYGFGYFGNGFEGGRWQDNRFYYNRAVVNVNVTNIHTVYNTTVINRGVENRISYNGGNGGINARPTPAQEAFDHERHLAPIAAQTEHIQQARRNPELRASTNQGKPPIAATDRPGSFSGHGVVPAREAGAPYHPPANARENRPVANGGESRPANPTHASELPQHQVVTPPSSGDANRDRKYQQQQEKLVAKQNQEHQKLQQQQAKEDQRAQQQVARQQQNQARQQQYQVRQQQTEQRHAQQTQQMEMRHTQQTQSFQEREVRPAGRPH